MDKLAKITGKVKIFMQTLATCMTNLYAKACTIYVYGISELRNSIITELRNHGHTHIESSEDQLSQSGAIKMAYT